MEKVSLNFPFKNFVDRPTHPEEPALCHERLKDREAVKNLHHENMVDTRVIDFFIPGLITL